MATLSRPSLSPRLASTRRRVQHRPSAAGTGTWSSLSLALALLGAGSSGSLGCDGSSGGAAFQRVTASGVRCEASTIACGDVCVSYQDDPNHCGDCGNVCGASEICDRGGCVPLAQGCSSNLLLCEMGCRDTDNHLDFCGDCDTSCPSAAACNDGQCECPDNLTVCGSECVDLLSDESACGQCDIRCVDTQTCEEGACSCPDSETLCGDQCSDLLTDLDNCGSCDNACIGGQLCGDGECACPDDEDLCDDQCTDTQSDVDHCGVCGNACSGGQICGDGECVCPPGQALCDEVCIDILSDNNNCGECGLECGLGDGCNNGGCASGLAGADGCQGLAQDIAIDQVAAYQTVKVELMLNGESNLEPTTELVAGRETLVRLFVDPLEDWEPRELSARLHIDTGLEEEEASDGELDADPTLAADAGVEITDSIEGAIAPISVQYSRAKLTVTAPSEEADRGSTFEFLVPGDLMTSPGKFAVELVECSPNPGLTTPSQEPTNSDSTPADETSTEGLPDLQRPDAPLGDTSSARFPSSDGVPFNNVDTGALRVHILPIRANGRLADTSEDTLALYRRAFELTFPVGTAELTVGEPLDIDDPEDWNTTLNLARNRRQQDNPDPDVYYYGLVQPTERFGQFCQGGCVAGVGFVPGGRFPNASLRVSVGLSYGDSRSAFTMLHEVAHNHGRGHAPCVPQGGGIEGVDQNYPYNGGSTGVFGYIAGEANDQLINPANTTDLMGYCNNQWLSDYTYNGLFDTVLSLNSAQATQNIDAARIGNWRIVLLDDVRGTRWGVPVAGPAVAAGTAEEATAIDETGAPIESVTVYRSRVADLGYSIEVPEPEPDWAAILIDGAELLEF